VIEADQVELAVTGARVPLDDPPAAREEVFGGARLGDPAGA